MDGPETERMVERVRERLAELREKDLSDAEVEAEVSHLLAGGETVLPILLEQFREEDETLLAVATQTLKRWGERRPVEPLLALLQDPGVGDLAKALILNILERYGLNVDDPNLLGLGINLEEYRMGSGGDGQDEMLNG